MTGSSDYIRTVFSIFLYLIMVVGVIGNAMVIIIIIKSKDMRNSTYIFLVNLAIADLMVLLVWGNSSLLVYVNSALNLKPYSLGPMCKAVSFFELTMFIASVLTILAIGFERYYAFCQPLKALYVCTKTRAYTICILTWVLAALSSSPSLFISFYKHGMHVHGTHYKPACLGRIDSLLGEAYIVASASVFFFLPLITLIIVFLKIKRQLAIPVASSVNITAAKRRRNLIVMLATLVLVFFVCHLPRRVVHFLILSPIGLQSKLGLERFINLTFVCEILIFFHSALNPVLYNLMSDRFRAGFKNIYLNLAYGCGQLKRALCLPKQHTNTTMKVMNVSSVQELEA